LNLKNSELFAIFYWQNSSGQFIARISQLFRPISNYRIYNWQIIFYLFLADNITNKKKDEFNLIMDGILTESGGVGNRRDLIII
jgi:hypothetical protein